ncbi:uncharacterized protein [Cherax quadricarinatus]
MEIEYGGGYDVGSSVSSSSSKRRQHCTYCKNHARHSRKTNHKCEFENCECLLCKLTRLSRLIMRHQQRLWRHLKDSRRREDAAEGPATAGALLPLAAAGGSAAGGEVVVYEASGDGAEGAGIRLSSKQQKCDMCRNHGVMKEKRAHKNDCPYQSCPCELCGLSRKRRNIMKHQQRVRRSQVTSQQRNEAYDYVTRTTAELAQMSIKPTPTTTTTPTPTTPSTSTPMAALPPPTAPAPGTSSSCAQPSCVTTTPTVTSTVMDAPPLEVMENSPPRQCLHRPVLPEPRNPIPLGPVPLHCDAAPPLQASGFQCPLGSSTATAATWRNLKRDQEEIDGRNPRVFRETSLFRNLDFMRGNNNLLAREDAMMGGESICTYDTVGRMELVTCHNTPYALHAPALADSSLTAPSKKTRFTFTNEDLRYSHRFWGTNPMETDMNRVSDDLQHVGYRRMVTNSQDVRMRSPPALIPLPQQQQQQQQQHHHHHHHQQQPLRPQPLTPLRHPTFRHSVEWDPVSLPYLAYSLLQTRTYNTSLPTSPFGLGRVAPFLNPSVP